MFKRKAPSPAGRDSQYGRWERLWRYLQFCLTKMGFVCIVKTRPAHNSPLLGNRQLYIFHVNSKWPLLICIPSFKSSHPSSSEVSWPAAEKRLFLYECIIGHWWTNRHSLSLPDLGKKFLTILPDVHVSQHNLHIIYKVLNVKNNGSFQLTSWQMMIAVHFMWEASTDFSH